VLYDYTNKEQDLVKNAFRIGNYHSLRDLPDAVEPFSVTHNLKIKVQDANLNSQITSQNSKIYREILKGNGGVFQKFGWHPDPFSEEEDLKRDARYNHMSKIKKPWQPSQVHHKMKYEWPFLGREEIHTRDFLMSEDPYSVGKSDALRAHWIEEAKLLYGHFKPSGPAHPIHHVSKSLMKEIVDCVKKLLLSDWNDVNFVLGSKFALKG